jgi:hypothetical protein
MSKITLCITTHCIKTESQGTWAGVKNVVPSTPSTKLIESVLKDFFFKTNLNPEDVFIHIGFDKRVGREIDNIYHRNLLNLESNIKNLKIFTNESEIDDPIVTAPKNFINLIDSVKTELYIFWEHDWIFKRKIDLKEVIDEIEEDEANPEFVKALNQAEEMYHGGLDIETILVKFNPRMRDDLRRHLEMGFEGTDND